MRHLEKSLTFITPAFLAGANQNSPEVRAPSIRGVLRWWFRVLGGTIEEEKALFGGVHNGTVASAVRVRVVPGTPGKNKGEVPCAPNTPYGYLSYFAKVSGNKEDIHRTQGQHYLGEGATFTLLIDEVRPAEAPWEKLTHAVEAFCTFGALGLRATRGFGALAETPLPTPERVRALAKALKPRKVYLFEAPERFASALKAHEHLGATLQDLRKSKNLHPTNPAAAALGASSPRQAAALHLRPLQSTDGFHAFCLYTDNACDPNSLEGEVRDYLLNHHWQAL
ncbi:MAG: type III-B CRISPR module RAMP protein Cmr1 [Candidatus Spyradenecus sp.]